jgi:hypothetical protein
VKKKILNTSNNHPFDFFYQADFRIPLLREFSTTNFFFFLDLFSSSLYTLMTSCLVVPLKQVHNSVLGVFIRLALILSLLLTDTSFFLPSCLLGFFFIHVRFMQQPKAASIQAHWYMHACEHQ